MDSVYVESFGSEYVIRVPKTLSQYDMQEIIGKGGTSVVVKAFDTKNKRTVACKLVDRSMFEDKLALSQFERESRLFARLNHPSIAKLYDVIYLPDIIVIVMEYCRNGTILSNILNGNFFSKTDILKISYELLEGIQYMHMNDITHRDIKPDNVGLDDMLHPKIIDFGLCRESNKQPTTTKCGSPYYIAPEVLTKRSYDPKKVDIWSYGVTVHVLATGLLPWCMEEDQFLHMIFRGDLKPCIKCEGDILKIVSMSLVVDPNRRASADEILASGVFDSLKKTVVLGAEVSTRMVASYPSRPTLQNAGRALSRKRFVVRRENGARARSGSSFLSMPVSKSDVIKN